MEAVAVATEQGTPETPFPITSVANAGKWFHWEKHSLFWYKWTFVLETTSKLCRREEQEDALLAFIRVLYDKKIGEITSRWNDEIHLSEWVDQERISFDHAQVKLGDVFDYYTINGELTFPQWAHFKYVVEDYLKNHTQVK
ncbi:hypothetical protein PR003_g25883 [Phytophthora rubi]|uniref:Uncharacterized protein n=1 Tax=Phytophthora rubi TaxID=129364 RepID=A0A6A4CEB5_9STRA|nr:hypothetical protein PR002_g18373 [Phytophthora rubi]KAE9288106.1 hypothetical protein PR003_g25883 [Phytophthora rubi]